jgi:acyl carrier protein
MNELKTFIQNEIANIAFTKADFDESLIKSKLLDSITVVDLLVAIEEKIGKKIPQYLVNEENLDTINKIVKTVEALILEK